MTTLPLKPRVLTVGRLYCDLIFTGLPRLPSLGTEVFTNGFGAHAGGGAFITAAHLTQLGHGTSMVTMLPPPPFIDLISTELEASKVDLSLSVQLAPTDGPQITVAMAESGDRAFLTRRVGPAFPKIDAPMIAEHGFSHLHVGELESLIAHPEILATARGLGMTISADCGWSDDFDTAQLKPLAGAVDVFLPNEAEMEALAGLAESFAPLTVVKMGAAGAMALTDQEPLRAAGFPAEAIDTTGAGDAFNAGFLSAWLGGQTLGACLEAGNRRGAFSVQNRGGFTPAAAPTPAVGLAGE